MSAVQAVWAEIDAHAAQMRGTAIQTLFTADPDRLQSFLLHAPHLTLDLSKERFDAQARALMIKLAAATAFDLWRARLFSGEIVNNTEGRAVLHTALRASAAAPPSIAREIAQTRAAMRDFAQRFRARALTGATGAALDQIVHIGIGGSDLGPRLLIEALHPHRAPGVELRFAANVDGAEIADALAGLDPARTLVMIVSKTFTTQETMANAEAARAWLQAALGADIGAHLCAISAAPEIARSWGVRDDHVFPFWDFIGGRYSLWSAVGLSVECATQEGVFDRLLAGAAAMDEHFFSSPLTQNAPFMSAALHVFNRCALGASSYVCAPYARRLAKLPAFLQQLEMESNGKSVTRDGRALSRLAAGVTWGEPGTNAQHSFFQLLHQGGARIPVEFVFPIEGGEGPEAHRALLLANVLAQAEALLVGRSLEDAQAQARAKGQDAAMIAPHRVFSGDRPSSIIALDRLDPECIGALLAFYEHRTFAQGVLMEINSFDQWGVELGKELANTLAPALRGETALQGRDPSTAYWAERLRR